MNDNARNTRADDTERTRRGTADTASQGVADRWAVLLAGHLRPTPRLRQQLAGHRVIAADAGLRHAEMLKVHPDLIIGDFDSAPPELLSRYQRLPRIEHPADKDMTDGALAIEHALQQGARQLLLIGALGGPRSDHATMHLLQLAELASRGIQALASSGLEEAWGLAAGEHAIDLPPGATFSLLAFTDLRDVHLHGARWPLQGDTLPFGHSRPMSNVVQEVPLRIRIGAGHGVLLAHLRPLRPAA